MHSRRDRDRRPERTRRAEGLRNRKYLSVGKGWYEADGRRQACAFIAFAHPAGTDSIVLQPGQRAAIETGLCFAIPEGYCGQIWPRSGLAVKNGVDTLAGMIDCDYRGEVKVALINHGQDAFTIERGMRIAQFLIAPYARVESVEVAVLPDTARGAGGFGSTGK